MSERPLILVTGGLGYIGSHTVIALHEAGYDSLIIDNLSNSRPEVLDKLEKIMGYRPHFLQTEMCESSELKAVFNQFPHISTVIHFAAFLEVNESVELPLKYYRNNLLSTLNLLECIAEKPVPIVFSSSCTVYGNPDQLPVSEDAAVKPAQSPYGNTKKICEEMIADACRASGIRAVSLRYFNPIGAHQSALIGEVPHGVPTHLMPYITQTAQGIRPHLNIFGSDYSTPDGTCVRDYIHVMDVARAHVAALDYLAAKNSGFYDFINIGTGMGVSVLQMVQAFEKATGIKVPYKMAPRRAGDVEAVYAATAKAERVLGWRAKESLESMMQDAWRWELALQQVKG